MILQSAFQNDRDKVYASQEEIKAVDERYAQGLTTEIEQPEAGFFDGIGEAWKGLPAGGLKSMSLLEEVAANTGLSHINPDRIEQESGYVIEDAEKHEEIVRNRLESDAKAHREEANGRFGIEPETVGMAGRFLYGVVETLPKAVGYSLAMGPAAGAALFGADYGGSQYLELRDKGVDKKTAAAVGAISGFAGAVGVAIPATFGMTRPASATIGALANMGLTGAELGAVGWILDRQNYDALAEQYGFNMTSVITSGVFGGVFGGAMWRPRGRAQAEPIQRFDDVQRKTVNQSIYEQLKAVGGKYDDDVVAHTQADLHANAIENLSRVYDVPFESVESVLPRIVRDDGALNKSAFNQIIGERGARNLGVDTIDIAREMAAKGKDAKAIRFATGWEKGADSRWRYEIGDGTLDDSQIWQGNPAYLRQVYDAPELYKAYPQLRDVVVMVDDIPEGGAQWDKRANAIVFNAKHYDVMSAEFKRSTIIHEIQHAVQDIEGFNRGGNKAMFRKFLDLGGEYWKRIGELRDAAGWSAIQDEVFEKAKAAKDLNIYKDALDEFDRTNANAEEIASLKRRYEDWEKERQEKYGVRFAGDAYHNLSGEVESRNSELRKDFTSQERREKLLVETEDVPREEQISYWIDFMGNLRLNKVGGYDPRKPGKEFNQIVWHGSPHKFDEFSLAHIGTGEGAQAHGWGLYFAGGREVAEGYRSALAGSDIRYKGKDINYLYSKLERSGEYGKLAIVEQFMIDQSIPKLREDAASYIEEGFFTKEDWDWFEREVAPNIDMDGRVFQVDIPDNDVMLDEQMLLKDQPKFIQDAIKKAVDDLESKGLLNEPVDKWFKENVLEMTGSDVYWSIGAKYDKNYGDDFDSTKATSLLLNKHGIKGITYVGERDGRCFVVFDDKAVKTIEYYQESGKRGSYNPASREIKLTPNANLSTFSHEMGHWYLDTMMGLSGRGSDLLDSDIATLLREFGVKSVEDWNALGVEGQRKYHEQFASWLEVYLSKGEAPNPSLKDVLARVAQWIVDVYESFGGTQKAVEGRFESEFGTKLPEMSEEVKAVMDRLFSEQKANRKMAAKKPTMEQVAAGRVVLQSSAATARIQKLLKKDRNKLTAKDARDLQDALRASDIAAQQMANGQAVDVADVVGDAEIDESMMKETRGNFAREFLMGGDDSQAVVLQNRDRDTVASVAQMNRIAAKPDYYLASFSRSLQDGAPIVSFGSMPDNAHLGVGDIVVGPNGRRIPVQYAVIEADSVLTSNDYLGNANPDYGNPSMVNVVAGNGRATGIREGYNRGTADQYKADMIADTRHGVDAEVIKAMKKPLLVRFIGKDEVTSKLIEESNKQSTLARSPVEQAVDDAKLIARNVDKYQFDEDGLPTQETVQQFVADIQDPNALGRLLTPYGTVTPEAVTRVQNAVVQAAYGDMPFTQLFAMETKPGAKRLMNALVAAAPRFVEIRNSLGSAYDFSRQLLEGFKQVRESMLAGQDSVIQSGSIFGDDSASAFIDILDRNRNSMAGVMRELDPIFEAIKASQDSAGSMFGEEVLDLPEILSRVRQAENEARLAEGKPLLMDIDAEEMRQGIKAAQEMIEAVEEMQTRALEAEQVQDTQAVDPVERSRQMLTQDADAVRVQELSEEMPEMLFDIEDENGQMVKMSIADITALNEADLAKADTEAASMGEVFACVDLNRGIE